MKGKYRRILGTVYGNEKENWRIITSEEINAMVKKNLLQGAAEKPDGFQVPLYWQPYGVG